MRILAIIGLAASYLFASDEPKPRVQVTNTQREEFTSGGLLRFENSTGELMVRGWDRPGVEITTTKSSEAAAELDQIHVTVDHRGDELVVKTEVPKHGMFSHRGPGFDLEYYVKVPRTARLAVAHDAGTVHVEDLTGDIRVTARQGEITLRLPGEVQYAIDARSKFGGVNSDFPGRTSFKPWFFGHQYASDASSSAHKLYLRVGYGDIIIWKTYRMAAPAASH